MERLIRAFGYSLEGLRAAWRDEQAFRLEVIVAAFMLPLAVMLAPDAVSLALMAGSILLVMIVELLNSAVEAAIDRIGEDIHPLSKKAKDIGSAAVLVAIGNAGIIWVIVLFWPR